MDAITKFKEAAKEFQKDERYLRLAATKKANDEDAALQQLMTDFAGVRTTLSEEIAKTPRDEARVAALNTELNTMYNAIMANENMQAYNSAKEDIELFMQYVNAILNAALDGEDPMAVEEPVHACPEDGCSSCSGCC